MFDTFFSDAVELNVTVLQMTSFWIKLDFQKYQDVVKKISSTVLTTTEAVEST